MFSLINFPNDECTSTDDECGTCMTASECSGYKGLVSGTCAQGFGSCCVLSYTQCGGTLSTNRTYITNPNYPSTYSTTGVCTWTLGKCSTDICPMRLDFEKGSVAQPNSMGICDSDYFVGTPAKTGPATPKICGENAGQHLYIESGAYTGDSPTLALTLLGTTARSWRIKVSMIECSSLVKPPQGCLQYHTGTTGTVSSFNYQDSAAYRHLAATSYTTCIRQEKGYCRIGWRQSDDNKDTFKMTRAAGNYISRNDGGCDAAAQADYVIIPNGSDGGAYNSNCSPTPSAPTVVPSIDKYCGGTLTCISGSDNPAEVVSNVRPFTLGVYTNANDNA